MSIQSPLPLVFSQSCEIVAFAKPIGHTHSPIDLQSSGDLQFLYNGDNNILYDKENIVYIFGDSLLNCFVRQEIPLNCPLAIDGSVPSNGSCSSDCTNYPSLTPLQLILSQWRDMWCTQFSWIQFNVIEKIICHVCKDKGGRIVFATTRVCQHLHQCFPRSCKVGGAHEVALRSIA